MLERSDAAEMPCVDLAQRPLDLGPLGQLGAGPVQLLDQLPVGHRRAGMVRERAHEGDLRGIERVSRRVENVPSAPNTWSPATSGATTIERIPMSATTRSGSSACRKAWSAW